jgi:protein tyrosine/serine phosphatase
MSTSTYVADRQASFERIFNFRDLGGYLAAEGRTVRWGRLYRSDGLHQLTDNDLDTLRGLGLRTVIDLRTHVEVAEHGHFPVDRHPVERHHLPVINRSWEDDERLAIPEDHEAAEFLTERYLDMLDEGGASFAAAVSVLASPTACPAVCHCAVGKDRTGVFVALVLSLLGVADDLIVHDYTLSALGMARIEDWLAAHSPEGAAEWAAQPAAWLASPPAAMAGLLAALRTDHGSTETYLLDHGVAPEAITAVRHNLLR